MPEIETEGKTVAEAVDNALRSLGLKRDQVEVQVLHEATSGFLGMGAKPARVRVAEKSAGAAARRPAPRAAEPRPPLSDTARAASETRALIEALLPLMGLDARLEECAWDPVQERVRCRIDGPDADRLVTGDARALESLQFLVTLVVSRELDAPLSVQVDARDYWNRREKELIDTVQRGVDEVKATGKPVRLQPMEPAMRRLIHRHFMEHPDVLTASEGEGAWRKIVIRPRKR